MPRGDEMHRAALNPGDTLGQYRVIRLLGRGGMGEVYEVEHEVLRKRYALKLLPADFANRPGALERFKREARAMAKLDHPNIVKVDEFGETDDRYWLRMELAEGGEVRGRKSEVGGRMSEPAACHVRSLAEYAEARGGRLDPEEAEVIFTQILEGLAHAHAHGVIHRDLKPANILICTDSDGVATFKISDFGLVRMVGEEWVLSQADQSIRLSMSLGGMPTEAPSGAGTSTRSLIGTYEYMSPEQKRGEDATAASDVYAVGLMMYRLLTGRQQPGFKRPSEMVGGLDAAWDSLLLTALDEEASDRFDNGSDMLAAMAELSDEGASSPPPAPKVEQDPLSPEKFAPAPGKEPIDPSPPKPHKSTYSPKRTRPNWSGRLGLAGVGILVALAIGVFIHKPGSTGDSRFADLDAKPTVRLPRPEADTATKRVRLEAITDPTIGNVPGMKFVEVAPGSFQMGSNDGSSDEKPVHTVRISQTFWMGKYEVTQAEYEKLMGKNPSNFKGGQNPVETVSWHDAVAFCKKLTDRERAAGRLPTGYEYRLPTEAEWEYAARGGAKSEGYTYSGSDRVGDVAWYSSNSSRKTHPVGQKQANELGLYDMSGNVWEWCYDWYGKYSSGAVTDPTGARTGSHRVRRGGGWISSASFCRSAYRYFSAPTSAYFNLGFRVVLAPQVQ